MFSLGLQREFQAQHYLVGADWGAENAPHEHEYMLEVILNGEPLNKHGFLLDIEDINQHLDELIAQFQGSTLNTLPDFEGLNPSLERFARILCAALANRIRTEEMSAITIKLWESSQAWASYKLEF
jgi:6-pyruvoyltetrahydropterin/6-carboxytetrahydropterin synthase